MSPSPAGEALENPLQQTATSNIAIAIPARVVFRIRMACLKSKAGLNECAMDGRQITAEVVPVFPFERRKTRDVIAQAHRGARKTGHRGTEDRVRLGHMNVFEPVVG